MAALAGDCGRRSWIWGEVEHSTTGLAVLRFTMKLVRPGALATELKVVTPTSDPVVELLG